MRWIEMVEMNLDEVLLGSPLFELQEITGIPMERLHNCRVLLSDQVFLEQIHAQTIYSIGDLAARTALYPPEIFGFDSCGFDQGN